MKNLLIVIALAFTSIIGFAQNPADWKLYWGAKNYDNQFGNAAARNVNLIQGTEIFPIKRLSPILDLQLPLTFGTLAHYDDANKTTSQTGIFGFHGMVDLHPDLNWILLPFVYGGLGVQQINGGLDFGAPIGAGLKLRVSSKVGLIASTGFRKSLAADRSSWLNALGFTLNLSPLEEKIKPKKKSNRPVVTGADSTFVVAKVEPKVDTIIKVVEVKKVEEVKLVVDTVAPKPKIEEKIVKIDEEAFKPKPLPEPKKEEVRKVLTFAMQNINFETSSAALKPVSNGILDDVYRIMFENPSVNIAIGGHTDNIGDEALNLKLSTNRAKACYNYLITKGIVSSRLTFAGFGSTLPRESNGTSEGRKANRRVEFVIARQ